jgi:hypothetical protein
VTRGGQQEEESWRQRVTPLQFGDPDYADDADDADDDDDGGPSSGLRSWDLEAPIEWIGEAVMMIEEDGKEMVKKKEEERKEKETEKKKEKEKKTVKN